MKKLLVILLLLFPVHGAWAVTEINCIYEYNLPSGYFYIYEEKNIITNADHVTIMFS